MEYPKIDVRDICGALGITYNSAFSVTYYLNMIYKLSLMQRAAEQSVQADEFNGHAYNCDLSIGGLACTCGKAQQIKRSKKWNGFC